MPAGWLQNKDPISHYMFPFQLELVFNQLFPYANRQVSGVRMKEYIKTYISH